MENFIELGLENKVFRPEDVAELVFGKLITNVDNVNLKAKTGTKFVTWHVNNCEVYDEKFRRELLWKIRGWKDLNYEFVIPRILCAIGYQCVERGKAADVNHSNICWTKIYSPKTPDIPNGNTLAIREIQRWHDWEMPFPAEEIMLLQHVVTQEISLRPEWFEALPQSQKEDIEKGVTLRIPDIWSGHLHYINKLYDLLIEWQYNADPAY